MNFCSKILSGFFCILVTFSSQSQTIYGIDPVIQTGTGYTAAEHIPANIPNTVSSGTVKFKAENEIILKKDFLASAGSDFHAYLVQVIYAELKDQLDASYYTTIDNKLNFKYEEKYTEGFLTFNIYNYKRQLIVAGNSAGTTSGNTLIQKPKTMGLNFITVPLDPSLNIPNLVATNEKDCYYILEVLNDKGQKKVLRFKYVLIR